MQQKKHTYEPFYKALQRIIDANNSVVLTKKKTASNRTQEARSAIIKEIFHTLRVTLGFKIKNPYNFRLTHAKAVIEHCVDRGNSPATIVQKLTMMRTFCVWIGKDGMIPASIYMVKDPADVARTYVATEDKSWIAKLSDEAVEKLISDVEAYDKCEGMRLRLQRGFGMRMKESIMFKPSRADKGDYLVLTDGTKGKRERVVPVDTPDKRDLIEKAKLLVNNRGGYLGNGNRTLKQAIYRFYNVMKRFRITKGGLGIYPHGLRHEYANDRYEELSGSKSPVRSGTGVVDSSSDLSARQVLTEELGHTRASVTTAYSGSAKKVTKPRMKWAVDKSDTDNKDPSGDDPDSDQGIRANEYCGG